MSPEFSSHGILAVSWHVALHPALPLPLLCLAAPASFGKCSSGLTWRLKLSARLTALSKARLQSAEHQAFAALRAFQLADPPACGSAAFRCCLQGEKGGGSWQGEEESEPSLLALTTEITRERPSQNGCLPQASPTQGVIYSCLHSCCIAAALVQASSKRCTQRLPNPRVALMSPNNVPGCSAGCDTDLCRLCPQCGEQRGEPCTEPHLVLASTAGLRLPCDFAGFRGSACDILLDLVLLGSFFPLLPCSESKVQSSQLT